MARRREIKGVAAGIASSFASRNNDIDGYWALGVLYKITREAGGETYALNLLSGESDPPFEHSGKVAKPFQEYLMQQLLKKGLEKTQIREALVEVTFNVVPSKRVLTLEFTWGEPFLCRVTLTDDLKKEHVFEVGGWCGQHDPQKERRSIRRYQT